MPVAIDGTNIGDVTWPMRILARDMRLPGVSCCTFRCTFRSPHFGYVNGHSATVVLATMEDAEVGVVVEDRVLATGKAGQEGRDAFWLLYEAWVALRERDAGR